MKSLIFSAALLPIIGLASANAANNTTDNIPQYLVIIALTISGNGSVPPGGTYISTLTFPSAGACKAAATIANGASATGLSTISYCLPQALSTQ